VPLDLVAPDPATRPAGGLAVIGRQQIGDVLGDGGVVIGQDGGDLGRIGQVFLDALSSEPAWMTVTSDSWAGAELVVPLALAELDRGRIAVPYSAALVRDAPRSDNGQGYLDGQHESDLLRHYGLGGDGATSEGIQVDGRVTDTKVRRPPSRRAWRLPRHKTPLHSLRMELRSYLEVSGLPGEELDDLLLATSEAAVNAIEHARSPISSYVDVVVDVDGSDVCITVRDDGRWRDPTPGDGRGRGLLLMSALSTLTVTVDPWGTTVTLKNRSPEVHGWSFRRRH
jgi:anti-sigma regulatory factor (Ser/Thr protein kinase)